MRTIGLIGGMSWESSAEYYRIINKEVAHRLGGFHSAPCILYSVDFAEIELFQHTGRWIEAAALLQDAARRLERAGAGCIVLCTNTMHRVADAIQASVSIPLLHIAAATGVRIQAQHLATVGLLGTRFTMEQDFYRERLQTHSGLRVLIPDEEERATVHRIIYEELVRGLVLPASREAYTRSMQGLADRGAEGIILGCTEIMLLVGEKDSPVPIFDTTTIHAQAAVDFALADARVEDTASE
jgi:aspartate racemase